MCEILKSPEICEINIFLMYTYINRDKIMKQKLISPARHSAVGRQGTYNKENLVQTRCLESANKINADLFLLCVCTPDWYTCF